MKLYTKPRPIDWHRLRPGDQIAINKRRSGSIINSEAAYMDADLDDRVSWAVVHHAEDTDPEGHEVGTDWKVVHTLGENFRKPGATCIMREVIELDPWTYVKSVE